MMRGFIFLFLVFAASGCGGKEAANEQLASREADAAAPAKAADEVWSGAGRNRLCLRDGRAGLIVYASQGDSNCSLRGSFKDSGNGYRIEAEGDPSCRIEARREGNALLLGEVAPGCAYYCGPKASYAGARFSPTPGEPSATDFAGDPLC